MATGRTIDVAKALHMQGRLAEAESLYRDLLRAQPNELEALEGLGVLLFQQGHATAALPFFARGVTLAPQSARFHANLGETLRTVKQLDRALSHLRKAAALDPTDVQAWNSLGLVAFDHGRLEASEHAYRTAIRHRPGFVHAHINLAATLSLLGRSQEAIATLRTALGIEPNNLLAHLRLATLLGNTRDPLLLNEAEKVSRRALLLAPEHPLALKGLANVLRARGRKDEAREYDQRAGAPGSKPTGKPTVGEAPPGHEGRNAIAAQNSDAGIAIESNLERPNVEVQALHVQAMASLTDGHIDEAERALEKALELDATAFASWLALARVHAERGRLEQSSEAARAALAIRPDLAEAYWTLASNTLGNLDDADIRAMNHLLEGKELAIDDRAFLHFSLAMVYDRRGLYSQAATHLTDANLLQSSSKSHRGLVFDADRHARFIARTIDVFTPEFIEARQGWGLDDPRPVFVVGFPRSGTTLTEQILAAHPLVETAGELHDMSRIFQDLPNLVGEPALQPFDALERLDREATRRAAMQYLRTLDSWASAGCKHVVDKMPENINLVGLIAILFPRAKVIVCRRDPRDVALSCWQIAFRTGSWNNDFEHIAQRLADFQRIRAHWERTRPFPCLEIDYEELVANLEPEARRLIDFIGLDWDPACLEFHSQSRVVRTPSLAQVRQPIHGRSVGRWRHYEPYLRPLFEAFERHGVEVPNVG